MTRRRQPNRKIGMIFNGWKILEILKYDTKSNNQFLVEKGSIKKLVWPSDQIFKVSPQEHGLYSNFKPESNLIPFVLLDEQTALEQPYYNARFLYSKFYNQVYKRVKVNKEKKAFKDIVGEEYQNMRLEFWKNEGFQVESQYEYQGITCDTAVFKEGRLLLLEEDKGSYLDGTFLSRAVSDATKIFNECIKQGMNIEDIPYYVISCPTSMTNFDSSVDSQLETIKDDIVSVFTTKFLYLPLSKEQRVTPKKYFKTVKPHIKLYPDNLDVQNKLISKIKSNFK